MFTSSARRVGDAAVLSAEGRIDLEDVHHWADALQVALLLGRGPILIDLGCVDAWSTTAQAALIRAAHQATAQGRTVMLCAPSERLRAATTLTVFEQLTSDPNPADIVLAGMQLPAPRAARDASLRRAVTS